MRQLVFSILLVSFLLVAPVTWSQTPIATLAEPISIGTQKQLFIDRYVVGSLENAHQVLNRPVKDPSNPIVRPEHPWEHSLLLGFGNVLYDTEDRIFKMWYLDWNQPWGLPNSKFVGQLCYATSPDGIHWVKPLFNLIQVNGSKATNVVLKAKGDGSIDSGNVIKDLHDPDPARRYKLLSWYENYANHTAGLFVAFSPDGIHWKENNYNPVATAGELGIGDTVTVLGFDESVRKYVAYLKGPGFPRVIGYSTSDDFTHWQKPKIIIAPDERDSRATQFYKMPVIKYAGLYLGMLYWYRQAGRGGPGTSGNFGDDTMQTQLAVSRDGIAWDRTFREAFISVGQPGAFDSGMIMASMPVVAGNEVFFYYGGFDQPHMSLENHASIGLARLRLDGFVSIEPTGPKGTMTTRTLSFAGQRLEVNANARGGGTITAEVLDEAGKPLKGFAAKDSDPIQDDNLHHTVTWNGSSDIGRLQRRPIRLKFYLQHAKLYAFQFVEKN